MKDRVFSQCGLLPAVTALKDFDFASLIATMPLPVAFRAFKTRRPPCGLDRSLALILFAILGKEGIDAHTRLELKTIHFHGRLLRRDGRHYTRHLRQNMSDHTCSGRSALIRYIIAGSFANNSGRHRIKSNSSGPKL